MKVLVTLATCIMVVILMSSCNQSSRNDVRGANRSLKEANNDVNQPVIKVDEVLKAKTTAGWNSFKNEADSIIASIEKQVTEVDGKISKASVKEKERLEIDLNKTKNKLNEIKLKLNQGNTEFKNDLENFDDKVSMKYDEFKREFKHDYTELETSLKDLFSDNVK